MDLQGKVSKSSDVVSAANQKFRIKTNFQPAGLISGSRANYTYINNNGDLVTQELNTSSEYIGASRCVIDQLFTPKRIHDQDSGFTENAYHSSGSVIFDNFIYFQCDSQGDNPGNITAKIRIPYRSCIEAANTQSFINIKSLEVSLKLLDKKDFFMFNKATNKYKIYKNDGSENEATITELYINKCELHNSVWTGDGDSLIQPSLRELSNVTISTKNIILNKDKTTYDDNIIVNFAPKYMICYFTDMDRNHSTLLNIKPSYFRVAVSGGAQSTKCNFDNRLEKDSAYWDMVNYCCNTLREQSLVTYNRWNEALHYFVFPLSEMFSFKASNIIELNLIFSALTQGCVLNVIFIKDSSA
nr:hypothetical protein [uncultured Methanosphaera sp.]